MAQVSFYKINNNQLNSVEVVEGQVIFVQDTGELYIDKDSSHRIQVSNGNAIRNLIDDVATGSIKGIGTNGSFGQYSFSEGSGTVAYGNNSHAEGKDTAAIDDYSHVEGQGSFDITTITGDANATTYSYDDTSAQIEGGTFIVLPNLGIAQKVYSADVENATFTVTETLSSIALSNEDCFVYYSGIADGIGAHSEGYQTLALANGAHAEGWNTIASFEYSHAEGNETEASYLGAHAEGGHTQANGMYSHAEGQYTIANGNYSHTEGQETVANEENSHAEGYCTIAYEENSHAEGSGQIYSQYIISGAANATTYMYADISLDPDPREIKVGEIVEYKGNIAQIVSLDAGNGTFTLDKTLSYSEALTDADVFIYLNGFAIGWASHVEGQSNIASGSSTHAEGYYTKAIGEASHTEGNSTTASGNYSHAEGGSTKAIGNNSHSEGSSTKAIGNNTHVEGYLTIAKGDGAHVEGNYTVSYGNYSHAEGSAYDINRVYLTLSGSPMTTTYEYSYTTPKVGLLIVGDLDIAEITAIDTVNSTITINRPISSQYWHYNSVRAIQAYAGLNSHLEGCNTNASGEATHAEGYWTRAIKKYQHVQGKYNVEDPGDTNDATMSRYAHIIGNGTANNARSNAHTIDWAGNAWFAGDIKIGGTSYDNATTVIAGPASSTTLGGLKVRYDATTQTLYIRNDGSDA